MNMARDSCKAGNCHHGVRRKYMGWTDFCRAIFRILESESLDKENVDDTSVDIVRNLCSPLESYGLPTLLELTEHAICSDPTDRIYSLLALSSNSKIGV
jgi:hypothetical protein